MRLINDDGIVGADQFLVIGNCFKGIGESLQCDYDDLTLVMQCLHQSLVLGTVGTLIRCTADHFNNSGGLLNLTDSSLDVGVQAVSVRNDDHGVKRLVPIWLSEADQLVCQPRNRIGLAGTCAVLHKVGLANTLVLHVCDDLRYTVPLMETGEILCGDILEPACSVFLLVCSDKDIMQEDSEPVVTLADVIPEVACRIILVPGLHRRIACVAVFRTTVERQELRLSAFKVGAHPDFILGNGKMNDCTALEHEQIVLPASLRLNRLAFILVFLNGITDGLRHFCLDFSRSHRNAVDKEHEIQGLLPGSLVMHLTHDTKDIGLISLICPANQRVVRAFSAAGDRLESGIRKAFAERLNRSVGFQGGNQTLYDVQLKGRAEPFLHLCQLVRVEPALKLHEIGEVDGMLTVIACIIVADHPFAAVAESFQLAGDVLLKLCFKM